MNPVIERPDIKDKNDFLLNCLYYLLAKPILNGYWPIKKAGMNFHVNPGHWNFQYENPENLESVKDKPFVILPEHERWWDIPIHDMILKELTGRYGYYLMKAPLPKGVLGIGGGIQIARKIDIKKGKITYEEAKLRNEYVFEKILPYLLQKGEIIVDYIGGTRNKLRQKSVINRTALEKIHDVQKINKKPTIYVPIGTQYENMQKPRSKVILRVGQPFQASDGNIGKLEQEISKTFFKQVEFV